MANASIRAAGVGDVEVLCQLNAEVHALHVASRPDQFKPTRVEELADWFGKLLQNPAVRAVRFELRLGELDSSGNIA